MFPESIDRIKALFQDYDPHGTQDLVIDPLSHELVVVDARSGEKCVLTGTDQKLTKEAQKQFTKLAQSKKEKALKARETADALALAVSRLQSNQTMSGVAKMALKLFYVLTQEEILGVVEKLNDRAAFLEMEARWGAEPKVKKELLSLLKKEGLLPGDAKAPDVQLKKICDSYNARGIAGSTGEDWTRYLQRDQIDFVGFEPPPEFPPVNVEDSTGARQKARAHWLLGQFAEKLGLDEREKGLFERFWDAEVQPSKDESEFSKKLNEMAETFREHGRDNLKKLSLMMLALNQKFFIEPGIAIAQIARCDPQVNKDLGQYPGSRITLAYDEATNTLTATGKGAFCNKQVRYDASGLASIGKTAENDPVRYLLRYDCSMTLNLSHADPRWEAGEVKTKVGIPILAADEEKAGALFRLLEAAELHLLAFQCRSLCKEDYMP